MEIVYHHLIYIFISLFRNNNPDKGTEICILSVLLSLILTFRNNNPDEGTETYQDRNLV